MSTFKGLLSDPDLGFIAIDYFKPERYNCSAFFLSHVHWDHLQGLFDFQLVSLINESSNKLLYCSTFTAHLLTKFSQFAINQSKIVAMDVNQSTIIPVENRESDVVVTCLAAGHCPGSVMFLFEYLNRRYLYTGDFRIRVEDMKKVRARLTNDDGSVIPIDELYLDTTFAFKSLLDDFPLRESSEKLIVDRIQRWKWEIGSSLKIIISLPYRYGVEYLYINLSKRFERPISVHDYDSYAQVEEVASHVVSFEAAADDSWFIHACMRRNCPLNQAQDVKVIRPCALSFLSKKNSLTVDPKYNVPFEEGKVWRVFYSSHCSLKELRDVVEFVQPNKIFPNVRSETMTDLEMIDLLRTKEPKRDLAKGDADSRAARVLEGINRRLANRRCDNGEAIIKRFKFDF